MRLLHGTHGTWFYAQLTSLKIFVNDKNDICDITQSYFSGQFLNQIAAQGEQVCHCLYLSTPPHPLMSLHTIQSLEAARTQLYYYQTYNLQAMVVCTPTSPPARIP